MPLSALVVMAITSMLALGSSVSMAQTESLQRLIRYEVDGGYRGANTESIYNLRPIMTVSIGVSFYSGKAQKKFPSLPAHALSAAMVVDSLNRSFQYRFSNDARLRLVTDLRMPPGQLANLGVLDHLAQSVGVEAINNPKVAFGPTPLSNQDGNWPYFGNNKLVGRQVILDEVARALRDAPRMQWERGMIPLLFYFSAHGAYAADGNLYLIPADAEPNDPATWLKAEELLAPIYEFAASDGNVEMKRRVLVVLDICQQGEASTTVKSLPAPPRGVAVVQSASPGQHAWHFMSSRKFSQSSSGSTGGKRVDQVELKSTMSFFPISLRRSFAVLGADLPPLPTEPGADGKIGGSSRYIKVKDLLEATAREMKRLVDADAFVQRAGGQTMSVKYGEGAEDMSFVDLFNAGVGRFELPLSKREGRVYAEEFR